MTPQLFDRRHLALHRARALRAATPGADFLLTLAAEDLSDRLAAISRRFQRALLIGDPTGQLARAVAAVGSVGEIVEADWLVPRSGASGAIAVIDDEALPYPPESFDLVLSCLSLQWANDLPGALIQIRRILRPDGLFLGLMAGGDTLSELRQSWLIAESERHGGASPRVAPMAEVRDLGGLLQRAGFALPVADQDRLTLRYATPFHLMNELKAMGATNGLAGRKSGLTPPSLLMRAAEVYARDHADPDGRIRATLALVSLSGWAPHESQQKPLRPGSARMRLADALAHKPVPDA